MTELLTQYLCGTVGLFCGTLGLTGRVTEGEHNGSLVVPHQGQDLLCEGTRNSSGTYGKARLNLIGENFIIVAWYIILYHFKY